MNTLLQIIKMTINKLLNKQLSEEEYQKYLKIKRGVIIGKNCRIFSNIDGPESYLITLGNNVTIATGAKFITHDHSISVFNPIYRNLYGRITIGNNCFIGAFSIILPGISISDNTIIAAGAVVSKSIYEEGYIWGGNPIRRIGRIADFGNRLKEYSIDLRGNSEENKRNILLSTDKLIKK